MKQRFYIQRLAIVNALGNGVEDVSARLFMGDTSGMVLEDGLLLNGQARVGRVSHELIAVPDPLKHFNCRNNQLLLTALAQIEDAVTHAISRYGRTRVGVVLGSSTAGMAEGEMAFASLKQHGSLPLSYHYSQQEIGTPAVFLAKYLNLCGPAYTVCTACTSSAKAFQSARNLLKHGICDVVLVGGVDSLCRTTVNGFASLESISTELTNPMSVNRSGINIGEGAALFLLGKEGAEVELLGIGESSDAYHMSAPHPEGLGAVQAMQSALNDAGINAKDIGYLNLHATATLKNDEMESKAVSRVFPSGVASSGTKPFTGHTLGAAGAIELAFCFLALQENKLPPHKWDGVQDLTLPTLDLVNENQIFRASAKRICMSNSFAFGGSNVSLIIAESR
jgi:3-oxoacyl-[acyl-carrier-protein] synthase-1